MPRSTSSNNSFSQHPRTDRSDVGVVKQMQQEADQYTRMYEWERRNLVTLEGVDVQSTQVANGLAEELKQVKASIARMEKDCDEGQTKKNRIRAKNLLKDIDIYDNKQNETVGEIQRLRSAIELIRQEKALYKSNLRSMETEIQRAYDDTERLYQDIEFGQNNSKTSQNIILDLKVRNETDKAGYYTKMGELNRSLREHRGSSRSVMRPEKLTLPNDTAQVLKRRLTKLINNNKEKIKLIDTYQRNMKIIDEAFTSIQQATGVSDIGEIQNTFIKGEEQNYGLLTYVDVLNQDIDNLLDSNLHLQERIKMLEKEAEQRQALLNDPTDDNRRLEQLHQLISKKKVEAGEFQKIIDEVQPSFQQLMLRLARSKFNTKYPMKAHQYETGGVTLNESTFDSFLSEMEEYTNQFLYFKGKMGDEPNSQIFAKTLMVDEIPVKDFKKRVVVMPRVIQELAATGASNTDDPELNRELLDNRKLQELAQRQIEKQKSLSVQERPKRTK